MTEESNNSEMATRRDNQELRTDFYSKLQDSKHRYCDYKFIMSLAIALNDIEKIEYVADKFEMKFAIDPSIWIEILNVYKSEASTEEGRQAFEEKCVKALTSLYNVELGEFVFRAITEDKLIRDHSTWFKFLDDYGAENTHYLDKFNEFLLTLNGDDREEIERNFKENCELWKMRDELNGMSNMINSYIQSLEKISPKSVDKPTFKSATNIILRDIKNSTELSQPVKMIAKKFVYERYLSQVPLSEVCWYDYVRSQNGMTQIGILPNTQLGLMKRALYFRPTVRMNHFYIALMEEAEYDVEKVKDELKILHIRLYDNVELLVELYLDQFAFVLRSLRRRAENVIYLRNFIKKTWHKLSYRYGNEADKSYEILQFGALVEYVYLSNPTGAQEIWEKILGYEDAASQAMLWLNYAQMDNENNNGLKAINILQRALAQPNLDNPKIIQDYYKRLERCYGTAHAIALSQAIIGKDKDRRHQSQFPASKQNNNKVLKMQKSTANSDYKKPEPKLPNLNGEDKNEDDQLGHSREIGNLNKHDELAQNRLSIQNLYQGCTLMELMDLYNPLGDLIGINMVPNQNIAYAQYLTTKDAVSAAKLTNGLQIGDKKIKVTALQSKIKSVPNTKERKRTGSTLIPSVLLSDSVAKRRKLLEVNTTESAISKGDTNATTSVQTAVVEAAQGSGPKKLSNDDFRKFLLK